MRSTLIIIRLSWNKSLNCSPPHSRLRAGVVEFLQLAHEHDIPVLIFSGGIRDIIDVLLEREGCNFDNIAIISNRLKFSAEDVMVGAEEPYITASSKLEVAKQNAYFAQVKRDNVLLLVGFDK